MINERVAIIGMGNMGKALSRQLLASKTLSPKKLLLSNKLNNKSISKKSQVIILAVKPKDIEVVLPEIKSSVKEQLIISVVAGFKLKKIKKILGSHQKVIRAMPNICSQVGSSITCWFKD